VQERRDQVALKNRVNYRFPVLLCETLLILIVFNASSYFATTTYSKSINIIGIALVLFLLFLIYISSRLSKYSASDLGLTIKSVSRRQWKIIFAFIFLFYFVAFTVELLFPSEIRGEVTLTRLLLTAIFSLTFGPIFEELLFRGYLFKRSHDAFHGSMLNFSGVKISFAAIFSGIAFGLWHFPSPIILLYFNEPVLEIYKNLWGTVLEATIMGIFLGEIRHRIQSIVPGSILHFCANSMYVVAMTLQLL